MVGTTFAVVIAAWTVFLILLLAPFLTWEGKLERLVPLVCHFTNETFSKASVFKRFRDFKNVSNACVKGKLRSLNWNYIVVIRRIIAERIRK
jgi:hypothetical protein